MNAATVVLNAERLDEIFVDCLFKEGEDAENRVMAEGILHEVGFNQERLESHRQEIQAMLAELPDDFQALGGGGHTFLNACLDRHGNQWTGLHQTMEKLVLLGLATQLMEYVLPRQMWKNLYGGMPYIVVKDTTKTGREFLELCAERALTHYDKAERLEAVGTFMSEVKLHPDTAKIAENPEDLLASLSKALGEGRETFKETMLAFDVDQPGD